MSQTVYYAAHRNGGRFETYHTDKDCRLLQNARNIQSTELHKFVDREQCDLCAGELEYNGDADMSYYHALVEAGGKS